MMIIEDTTTCPKCDYLNALTHYSNDALVNCIACPKCRTFFNHGEEKEEKDPKFWSQVEKDTGYDG